MYNSYYSQILKYDFDLFNVKKILIYTKIFMFNFSMFVLFLCGKNVFKIEIFYKSVV